MAHRNKMTFLICLLAAWFPTLSNGAPPAAVTEDAASKQEILSPAERASRQRSKRFSEAAGPLTYGQPEPIADKQRLAWCSPLENHKSKELYFGKAIRARVVVRDTREPVEGALMLASWGTRRTDGTDGRPPFRGIVYAVEVLTDKDGYFEIAAWGPLPFIRNQSGQLPDWTKKPEENVMLNPFLMIYKKGRLIREGELPPPSAQLFRHKFKAEPYIRNAILKPGVARESDYNNAVIPMDTPWPPREEGDETGDRWARSVFELQLTSILADYARVDPCAWQRFKMSLKVAWPHFVATNSAHYQQQVGALGELIPCDPIRKKFGCESFQEFIAGGK